MIGPAICNHERASASCVECAGWLLHRPPRSTRPPLTAVERFVIRSAQDEEFDLSLIRDEDLLDGSA